MDDSCAQLDTSQASCSLSPSYVAGQPLSDGGWEGRSGNLGYQCVMRHCIKGSCQVYGHTHCTVRWFLLAEAVSISVVSWRTEYVVECLGMKLC